MRLRIKDDNVLKNLNDQRNKIIKLRKRFTEENSLNILTTDLERCKARKRHDT
jgi:5-bromo-4-chloroindolyl phosphate hydrolysis protein